MRLETIYRAAMTKMAAEKGKEEDQTNNETPKAKPSLKEKGQQLLDSGKQKLESAKKTVTDTYNKAKVKVGQAGDFLKKNVNGVDLGVGAGTALASDLIAQKYMKKKKLLRALLGATMFAGGTAASSYIRNNYIGQGQASAGGGTGNAQ